MQVSSTCIQVCPRCSTYSLPLPRRSAPCAFSAQASPDAPATSRCLEASQAPRRLPRGRERRRDRGRCRRLLAVCLLTRSWTSTALDRVSGVVGSHWRSRPAGQLDSPRCANESMRELVNVHLDVHGMRRHPSVIYIKTFNLFPDAASLTFTSSSPAPTAAAAASAPALASSGCLSRTHAGDPFPSRVGASGFSVSGLVAVTVTRTVTRTVTTILALPVSVART